MSREHPYSVAATRPRSARYSGDSKLPRTPVASLSALWGLRESTSGGRWPPRRVCGTSGRAAWPRSASSPDQVLRGDAGRRAVGLRRDTRRDAGAEPVVVDRGAGPGPGGRVDEARVPGTRRHTPPDPAAGTPEPLARSSGRQPVERTELRLVARQ